MNSSLQWIPATLKTFALALPLGFLPFEQIPYFRQLSFQTTHSVQASVQVSERARTVSHNADIVDLNVNPIANIPTAEQWKTHIQQDLLPFWSSPDALGEPLGNFPSVRCNDGTLINPENPCPEVQDHEWLMTGDQYVVALSRQVYTYGVAFQLTGELQYLDYAKAGVDYLRQNALDREAGGAFSWWDAKEQTWGPELSDRNPSTQAAVLIGLAYYYYLTRDANVLQDILEVKDFIFETYYNPELELLQWQPSDKEQTDAPQLSAQLEQLTYMLLLTPILPEPEQTEWWRDMVHLSDIMLNQFYSEDKNVFLPFADSVDDPETLEFAPTIKAMWLMHMIGQWNHETSLVDFVTENAPKLLEQAFLTDSSAWVDGLNADKTVNQHQSWWSYAILNQFTASFALTEPSVATYLSQTYDYWFKHFVDTQFGEVWNGVDALTHQPIQDFPKQWTWKNGYHSFEHALVGYITSSQLHREPIVLYYAFETMPSLDTIKPYYYRGEINEVESISTDARKIIYKVTFSEIR
ncbi:MAG: hypothetical protein F6K11_35775 [Leptolyngbya sp. SIO3F4]|nr:hypothetical protein [Leptolyngbya sp. SIO3F4]